MELDNSFEGQSFINEVVEPSKEIKISIVEAKSRGHSFTAYIAYVIESSQLEKQVQRRYSQFFTLREILLQRWPGCVVPMIPRKYIGRSNTLMVINERIQYFTYFLNNIVKKKHLYESEEFQLFLTSNSPDVSKVLKELPRLKPEEMGERYRKAFSSYKYEQNIPMQLRNQLTDKVEPVMKFLKEGKIPLINIKKEVRELALRKEKYMNKLKLIYNDSLPGWEKVVIDLRKEQKNTIELFSKDTNVQAVQNIHFEKKKNAYWLLYEVLRLEIDQSIVLLSAWNSLNGIQSRKGYAQNRIKANTQELQDIKEKRFTLRTFLSDNVDDLEKSIIKENEMLEKDIHSIQQTFFLASSVMVNQVVEEFKSKRGSIWKKTWEVNAEGENNFSKQLSQFLDSI